MRRLVLTALVVAIGGGSISAPAVADSTRVVSYRGFRLAVPASWPVFDLATHPDTCVRFNRHAVYLGRPGRWQSCPASAIGRTEAILVAPRGAGIGAAGGTGTGLMRLSAGRVAVTATWDRDATVVSRALGRRVHASVAHARSGPPQASAARAATSTTFTGLGFDACSAPSEAAMQAWASSYQATGIYIGGANSACSQPNLTSAWVSDESAAGWRLIPTYVGLQAPANSCGCKAIVPARASSLGRQAATDAITHAQALGLGPGNPIYFDMEAYNPSTANTTAVLSFLSAWTTQIHADHYLSGVYSSSDSGIRDVAAAVGTSSFAGPDDLWVANWNGARSTADPNVPSTVFAAHERLHQYAGAHDETHSRVTINVDSDYLDGATAHAGSQIPSGIPVPPPLTPTLAVSPAADGTVGVHASWPGMATLGGWRLLAGPSPTALAPLGAAVLTTGDAQLLLHSEFPYFEAQALDASGRPLGTSPVVPTPAHLAIFGHSAFVGSHGNGTLPAGCFTAGRCVVSARISAGSSVLARTGGEVVPAGGTRILHFKLSSTGLAKLTAARLGSLPVRVVVRDVSGVSVATTLRLERFAVSGPGPTRLVAPSTAIQLIGATDFVYRHTTGGILAACTAPAPCKVSATLAAGRTVIATTTPQILGANEAGYVRFALTRAGRALMAHAKGNQLGAQVSLADSVSGARASGRIVLISYG